MSGFKQIHGNDDKLPVKGLVSEEGIEELRNEFVSFGGFVNALPEIGEVRDWTMIGIKGTQQGVDVVNLWLAMGGAWYSLNEYQQISTGSSANLDQFNTTTVVTIGLANTIYEVTTNWSITDQNNIMYDDNGRLTIQRAGRYLMLWDMSFIAGTNNQEYEAGLLKNWDQTLQTEQIKGWAHRKIGTASDVGSMGAGTILELRLGDVISLGIQNLTSTSNPTISHAHFTLNRIR